MNEYARYGLIGGVAVGATLGIEYLIKRNQPGASGESVAERIAGAVGGAVAPIINGNCYVPTFKTWFPVLQGTDVQLTTVANNNLFGVHRLAENIFGQGRGKMVALMVSLETHNGNLECRCFNCNLFNIHGNCNTGFISLVGTDRNKSYTGNGGSQTMEAFTASMNAFKGILERNVNYDSVLTSGDPDRMQLLMASVNFGGTPGSVYNRYVNGGTITNHFFRARYDRLVAGHIIP